MEITRSFQPSTAGMLLKKRTFLRSDNLDKQEETDIQLPGRVTYRIHVVENSGVEQLHSPIQLCTSPRDTLQTLPLFGVFYGICFQPEHNDRLRMRFRRMHQEPPGAAQYALRIAK